MRRSLAAISVAVTTVVAVAFLIPLALLVGSVVRDRALAAAFRSAAAIGPVLAVSPDRAALARALSGSPAVSDRRTTVYLPPADANPGPASRSGSSLPGTSPPGTSPPGTTPSGTSSRGSSGASPGAAVLLGPAAARRQDVLVVMRSGRPATVDLPGGAAVLQPVALPGGRLAVVEVDVPDAVLARGVPRARALLAGLALALVVGSVAVADRLAARVVRAAHGLSGAVLRLGSGDLRVRLAPDGGPAELRETAQAFNLMADRVCALIAAERELSADLSHRLRTPLAGLVLVGRSLGPGLPGDQVRALVERLEQEVDGIIRDARQAWHALDVPGGDQAGAQPGWGAGGGGSCDGVAVIRERLDFWGALADDQARAWEVAVPAHPVTLPVPAPELASVVDALLGNVFLHTPEGSAFAVRLTAGPSGAALAVADAGPGIENPELALQRGISSAGSSGLGLDIVARVAREGGGRMLIERSSAGGAQVTVLLPQRPDAVTERAGPFPQLDRSSSPRDGRSPGRGAPVPRGRGPLPAVPGEPAASAGAAQGRGVPLRRRLRRRREP